MDDEDFEIKFMDAFHRTIVIARILALMDGTKADIAYFVDQADFLLAYYLDNDLDADTLRRIMTRLSQRAPSYRDYLNGSPS